MEKDKTTPKRSFPLVLIISWVFIALLFGYSIWRDNHTDDASIIDRETTFSNAQPETTVAEPVVELSDDDRDAATARDTQRLTHIQTIRDALASYYDSNGNYPSTLDDLIPDFLTEVPVNPTPGGVDYSYTGIGTEPYMYYDLVYELEVGAKGVDPGQRVAGPDGLAF